MDEFYRNAGFLTRVLIQLRPKICPLDTIVGYVPSGSRVLDIGCGVGLFALMTAISARPQSVTAFDNNAQAIAIATEAAKIVEKASSVAIRFTVAGAIAEWPDGPFDVVSLIDVMHHVPVALRPDFLRAAADCVRPGGLLLYKDMAARPWWCAFGNRLHDFFLARQWIVYCPMDEVDAVMGKAGLAATIHKSWRRYWYAHEFAVFKKYEAV